MYDKPAFVRDVDVFAVSPQRLIVCLEESLYIHNIRDMKVLHTIRETPPNPSGESGVTGV